MQVHPARKALFMLEMLIWLKITQLKFSSGTDTSNSCVIPKKVPFVFEGGTGNWQLESAKASDLLEGICLVCSAFRA